MATECFQIQSAGQQAEQTEQTNQALSACCLSFHCFQPTAQTRLKKRGGEYKLVKKYAVVSFILDGKPSLQAAGSINDWFCLSRRDKDCCLNQ